MAGNGTYNARMVELEEEIEELRERTKKLEELIEYLQSDIKFDWLTNENANKWKNRK